MALKLQPTLSEMVTAVLDGLNLGNQGALNADLHPLIKRHLRVAQAFLWNQHPWLQNRVLERITLANGVTDYDLPDSFEPGAIERVYCASRTSSSTDEWEVSGGITPEDRTAVETNAYAGRKPFRFEFIDRILRVHPAPEGDDADEDNAPPYLYLEMQEGQSPLLEDEHRPAVDGEACIQLATILTKEQRRMPVGDTERQTHAKYVASLRGKQREPRVFTLGTDYVHPSEIRRSGKAGPYNRDDWRP